ncbi:hypothetical protein ABZ858_30290 [Streptomyces sp. NPDC047017]|uniref:hypothetical protein n=1 Tax=Streptomyces sp. NPDC047017 TaxID=3155024 RepID=UPI0033F007BD
MTKRFSLARVPSTFFGSSSWPRLRSRSAAAFIDEFQQQSAISAFADVHEK